MMVVPCITCPRPSPSVFAYCKGSKTGGATGGVESLGTRLVMMYHEASYDVPWCARGLKGTTTVDKSHVH